MTIWLCFVLISISLGYHVFPAHGRHFHHECGSSQLKSNATEISRLREMYLGQTKEMMKALGSYPGPAIQEQTVSEDGMRFHLDYQLDGLSAEQESFLRGRLMPAAVAVLMNTISVVRPWVGELYLPRYCVSAYPDHLDKCLKVEPHEGTAHFLGKCGHATHKNEFFSSYQTCTTLEENNPDSGFTCTVHEESGGAETDFYLYVTTVESEICLQGALAYAQYCVLDIETNRPLAGFVNFCPAEISSTEDDAELDYQIEKAIHEILHALMFSDDLFEKFIKPDGTPLAREDVLATFNERDQEVTKIVSPRVLQEVRDQFGCSTLNGAELEDDGGTGTAGNHWESRLFQGEVMDGMAGAPVSAGRHSLSRLTLALMEDSGWYKPDWESAGNLRWGREAGCSFAEDSCSNYIQQNPSQDWFCDMEGETMCTRGLEGLGLCTVDPFMNECGVIRPYSNADCKNPLHATEGSQSFGVSHQLTARCVKEQHPIQNVFRQGGSAFLSTKSPMEAGCYEVQCNDESELFIKLSEDTIRCPSGGSIDLVSQVQSIDFRDGRLECPDNSIVCPSLACPDNCNGQGDCVDGKCYCHLGYFGTSCSRRLCIAESEYCSCDIPEGKTYGACIQQSLPPPPLPPPPQQSPTPKQSPTPPPPLASTIDSVPPPPVSLGSNPAPPQPSKDSITVSMVLVASVADFDSGAYQRAMSDILGTPLEDVQILEFREKEKSQGNRRRQTLSEDSQLEVVTQIYSADTIATWNKIETADSDGSLRTAMENEGLAYFEGSITLFEEEDDDTSSGKIEEIYETILDSNVYTGSLIGAIVLAVVICCCCCGYQCCKEKPREKDSDDQAMYAPVLPAGKGPLASKGGLPTGTNALMMSATPKIPAAPAQHTSLLHSNAGVQRDAWGSQTTKKSTQGAPMTAGTSAARQDTSTIPTTFSPHNAWSNDRQPMTPATSQHPQPQRADSTKCEDL